MHIFCDRCGFERDYTGALNQVGRTCEVCGLGTLRQGQPNSGFTITRGTFEPVPRNLPVRPLNLVRQGGMGVPGDFNYFVGESGDAYQRFVRRASVYVGRFTNIVPPEPKRFAWLSPYTGNKHNRMYFTQLVLSHVARAKFIDNGGRLPRLIEPFIGSGQVFLNACHWGPTLGGGMPPFSEIIGGDLNHYVIGAYRAMARYGASTGEVYARQAALWDLHIQNNYQQFIHELEAGGQAAMADAANDPDTAAQTAFKYIWLVNRCTRGTKLTAAGGVLGTLNPKIGKWTGAIRTRERNTLDAVLGVCGGIKPSLDCRDFRKTTALATQQDIVFMDCPFPTFSTRVPADGQRNPERFGSETARTYGTGDDGADFQTLILNDALSLVQAGTTVIICNFANPGLITAYSRLLGDSVPPAQRRFYTYTYRSPSTVDQAYQLTVLPGALNARVAACPQAIMADWCRVGGDKTDDDVEEFFVRKDVRTEEDRRYAREARRDERRRQDRDQADAFVPDDNEDDDYVEDGYGIDDLDDDRGALDDNGMDLDDADRAPLNPDGFTVGTHDDDSDGEFTHHG
ncbi:MAG TPA: DNA adenine methylase [Streptomyces sp.]